MRNITADKDLKVGQRLATIRKQRALSQVELASKIGISQSTLTDYERGKLRLHDRLIISIAQALKVSTDELLGLDHTKNKNGASIAISLRIGKRLQKIEELPKSKQKALLTNIDNFLKAEGIK